MSFVGVYFVVAGRGTVDVVVKATNTDPKPVTITTNIFPCKNLQMFIVVFIPSMRHLTEFVDNQFLS